MHTSRALEIVDAIYAAAFNPVDWQRVIRLFDDTLHGTQSVFGYYEAGIMDSSVSVANFDPSYVESYFAHYNNVNPLVPVVAAATPGSVFDASEALGRDDFLKSEFFNDWLAPQGDLDGNTGVVLTANEMAFSVFCTHYRTRGEWQAYKAEIQDALDLLAPHFRRALMLRKVIDGARLWSDTLESGLDQLHEAFCIMNTAGKVRYMNPRAEQLVTGYPALKLERSGKLVFGTPHEHQLVLQMISSALNPAGPGAGDGSDKAVQGVRIRLASDRQVVAYCFPLSHTMQPRNLAAMSPAAVETRVLIYLVDPQRKRTLSGGVIAAVLGTTPAETRLVKALMEGKTLAEIANEHALSRTTIRNQLQCVFDKTGTRRQSDLVLLLQRTFYLAPTDGL